MKKSGLLVVSLALVSASFAWPVPKGAYPSPSPICTTATKGCDVKPH